MSTSNQKSPSQAKSFFGLKLTSRQFLTTRLVKGVVTLLVVAVFTVALGATYASRHSEEPAALGIDGVPVATLVAEPVESYDFRRSYTGAIVARRASDLSFERAGKLVELSADEGDEVRAGQVLGQLKTRHLLVAQQRIEAERARASAVLDELRAGPRKQTIAAARADVQSLTAQADQARLNYERHRTLRGKGVVTQEEYEDAFYTARAAAAKRDAAQRNLDELEAGTRKEQIAAQEAAVAVLDAQLADIALDIDDATLRAPYSGRIVKRHVDEGTVIAAGTAVFELVEQANPEAWIGLPADTASKLQLGSAHEIWVGGKPYAAVLTSLTPELDPATRTRKAIFTLQGDDSPKLVRAQVARVHVAENVAAHGYWLPADSLVKSTRGLWSALAVVDRDKGETVEPRDVEVLHTAGDRVLVRGTISPGDKIVASGVHRVVAGQAVVSHRTAETDLGVEAVATNR